MDLFYTPSERIDLSGRTLTVGGEEFFHITRSLRKKEGEAILLTDGEGLSIKADITKIGRNDLTAAIVSKEYIPCASEKVTVAMSLLKSSHRFDFFLEKATELGVTGIVPMISQRTVCRLKSEKANRKLERWRKVIVSAACQTKRYYFPEITAPLHFEEVLQLEGYDMKMIPYESSEITPEASFNGRSVLFIVGSEGGFTEGEIEQARKEGFREVSFGRSILRAETAGVFAVAMVRSQLLVNGQTDCGL